MKGNIVAMKYIITYTYTTTSLHDKYSTLIVSLTYVAQVVATSKSSVLQSQFGFILL